MSSVGFIYVLPQAETGLMNFIPSKKDIGQTLVSYNECCNTVKAHRDTCPSNFVKVNKLKNENNYMYYLIALRECTTEIWPKFSKK